MVTLRLLFSSINRKSTLVAVKLAFADQLQASDNPNERVYLDFILADRAYFQIEFSKLKKLKIGVLSIYEVKEVKAPRIFRNEMQTQRQG